MNFSNSILRFRFTNNFSFSFSFVFSLKIFRVLGLVSNQLTVVNHKIDYLINVFVKLPLTAEQYQFFLF